MNKVSTAVQLRFDVIHSPSLPPEVKERLARLAGSRMTDQGVLNLSARAYRTQEQNKADAIRRLAALVLKATEVPKERKRVRPSGAGRAREKQHRSAIKQIRREGPEEWE
jgi:ribosome-associated protein